MENGCLSFIGSFQLHIIVGSGPDIFHIFHIIIDTLDHMMTG